MSLILQIGGKERKLKINMPALEEFALRIHYANQSQIKLNIVIIYACLVGASFATEEEQDYTFEDVAEWVDQLYLDKRQDEINTIALAWGKSQHYLDWLAEFKERLRAILEVDENPKKKVKSNSTGSKLKSLPLAVSA